MSYGSVLYYFGLLLVVLSGLATIPLGTALILGETEQIQGFLGTVIIAGFAGGAGFLGLQGEADRGKAREWFLLPVVAWAVLPAFAALPFYYGGITVSLTDAYFEAVSGLTTTGATVLHGLDQAPRSILLWRALLQWLGGLGTVVLAVTLLSLLGVGGMQVFRSSIPRGEGTSMFARMRQIGGHILPIYTALSVLCGLALWAGGMPLFDAVCHAMSTISTGGFSTRDGSIGAFDSPFLELVLMIFMIVGALNFTLHATLIGEGRRHYRRDPEARQFLVVAGLGAVALAVGTFFVLGGEGESPGLLPALRSALFTSVSVLSTTGYLSTGQLPLPLMPALIVFALMMIGASTGSTGGGLKLMRFGLLVRQSRRELARLAHPHSVMRIRHGDRVVSDQVMGAIWAFFVLYMLCVAGVTVALCLTGVGFEPALTLAATALSNSGPAAALVSPVEVVALSDSAKWTLCLAMVVGRLEILTLLTLFNPAYWRI